VKALNYELGITE